jgi:primosomal protein N' (replication factor Y) (superfamily II helicase)
MVVARVLPDVTGLDRWFDYLVPERLAGEVVVGSIVRVGLHGRNVRGWVVALDPADVEVPRERLAEVLAWLGCGPSADVVDLARWAGPRWGTDRLRPFLVTASARRLVRSIPESHLASGTAPPWSGVVRLPPTADPLPVVREQMSAGPTLVLHPTGRGADALGRRLRKAGAHVAVMPDDWAAAAAGVDAVVGGRAAAWAPCAGLRSVVVLDEHDESYQEERAPTWHARDVAIERARRAGAGCVLVGPAPTVTALEWAGSRLRLPTGGDERAGWPLVEVVDRSDEPPWSRSLVSAALNVHLRDHGRRVACVLNTAGRSRLLACRSCRAVQRCEVCAAGVAQTPEGPLRCRRCGMQRPVVCQVCGSGAMANVRPGVTRMREELEAAAGRAVVEVTAAVDEVAEADVYIGTEALLHRIGRVDVVAFLDFDAELLAPRYRAAEQAMTLLVRAARLVGRRADGGRIVVQTTVPQHEVIDAALRADPGRLTAVDRERRRMLRLPPFGALAVVEGSGAAELVAASGLAAAADGTRWLLRAESWDVLGPTLAAVPRPKGGRLRIAVDPPR